MDSTNLLALLLVQKPASEFSNKSLLTTVASKYVYSYTVCTIYVYYECSGCGMMIEPYSNSGKKKQKNKKNMIIGS